MEGIAGKCGHGYKLNEYVELSLGTLILFLFYNFTYLFITFSQGKEKDTFFNFFSIFGINLIIRKRNKDIKKRLLRMVK